MVQTKYRVSWLRSIKQGSKHDIVISAYVFPCDPDVSRKRITKDLETKDRADSLNIIDKQYAEYLETLEVIEDEDVIDNVFYR